MARKSRKNIMPQSAAPEIRISEEVNLLRTAAYARLSSENSGHETEDTLNFSARERRGQHHVPIILCQKKCL